MKIWALSGFLGLPHDWNFLQYQNLEAVDWQSFPLNSLEDWGANFNHWVCQQDSYPKILMGYSLGGRLALHALINQPSLWQGAIIISAHPGLSDLQDRQKRLLQDLKWAKRFENENWRTLMDAWNGQEIFAQDLFSFNRKEEDYQRDQLFNALATGSLGKQENLCKKIAALPFPILWITGSLDARFCELAKSLSFTHPFSRWRPIDQAGHRVPWSQPHIFSETISLFLHEVNRSFAMP